MNTLKEHLWDYNLGMPNALGMIVLAVFIVMVIFVVASTLAYGWSYISCRQYADLNQQFDFAWTTLNGCLVRTEGMDIWIPTQNIRTLIQ